MMACLAALAMTIAKPPLTSASLAAVLEPIRSKHGLPALAAAVVCRGKVIAQAAVGVRKWGDPTPVTVNDQFHIGSITKSMTATLIACLVREHKLTWDATPFDVFPQWAAKMDPGYRKVTLRHLASHRSGTPNDSPWLAGSYDVQAKDERAARYRFVAGLLAKPPLSPPGETYAYSNNGYIVLGAIAEKVTGQTWEALMARYVFKPLGMKTAGYGPMGTPGKVDQPWQHVFKDGKPEPRENRPSMDNPPVLGPAGRVHCSIGDLARYANLHLQGRLGKSRLLPKQAFEQLHTPPFGGEYAFGWLSVDRPWAIPPPPLPPSGKAVFHNGSNNMNYAVVWMAPSREFAVAVACNCGGPAAEKAVDEVAGATISLTLKP